MTAARVGGDALPATEVDRARTEISAKSGLATGQVERALAAEELAARRRPGRGPNGRRRPRPRRPRAAITPWSRSYATEDELRRAFEERILLLEEAVKSSQLGIGGLRRSLMSPAAPGRRGESLPPSR